MAMEIFGGAMSGTSLDGVDMVLAGFEGADASLSKANIKFAWASRSPCPNSARLTWL